MEDASKALIIVAGTLIGLMVLSLGIALFSSLSQYTDSAQKQIEDNALQRFNTQFTKYINCADTNSEPEFTITIHDIITVANIAYENNKNYDLDSATDSNYYVTIRLSGRRYSNNNLEKSISNNMVVMLEQLLNVKYICNYSDVKFNEITGRVYEVTFKEMYKY